MDQIIDLYCERTAAGLWNEPLNASSNLAFFIAAFFVYRLMRREGAAALVFRWLLFLIVAIAAGSTLFHTIADRWSLLADILPIFLFQLSFVYGYVRYAIGTNWPAAVLAVTGFVLLTLAFGQLPRHWLNGSVGYLPVLPYLLALGVYHWRYKLPEPFILLWATAIFAVSLSFRSLDMAVCDMLPTGVHFVWHCLNGLLLYLVMRGLIISLKRDYPAGTAPL